MVKRSIIHSLLLLSVIVIAGLLLIFESDMLWKIEEQNLFLWQWLFFKEQMVVPGGMLTWLGTLFTQYLYHPWLGVLMLGAWWLLLSWLIVRVFRLSGWWCLLAVVPVLFILVTIVDMGYWVYFLKLRGHVFVTTIGTTAVVALLWGFRALNEKGEMRNEKYKCLNEKCRADEGGAQPHKGRNNAQPHSFISHLHFSFLIPHSSFIYVFLVCAIGYPLMGIYALGAALVMAVWVWRLPHAEGTGASGKARRGRALLTSVVAVASVIIVPLVCYRYLYYQINIVNIYFAELPLFFLQEEYHIYYLPYYLLLAFFVGMAARPHSFISHLHFSFLIPHFSFILAALFAAYFWYRDENYHHELAMQRCIERLDWEGVVREAAMQEDEPTRAIVVMRNIALARLGRQGDEMYRYKNGSKQSNAPFFVPMMMVTGPLTYYHYGLPNCCNRLCTEMGVEFEWRVEHLKYMLRCAVLNGERPLARKYRDILKQTTYYGEWAEKTYSLLDRPDDMANDSEMGFITHMMHYDNYLTTDQGYTEQFVMHQLTKSTYAGDPVFTEQALLASLWTRDTRAFWHHLANYVRLHPDRQPPIHVQEAAILFGDLEERPGMDSWPFDDSVRESYGRFCEITPQYDGGEVDVLRKVLYPLFGKTYYYDYYLMSDLPQY
ncbi:MAG: DUF805 domain-containing protein [Prevotella sp.]|nr:DUF805 domain-containing protein [Prevotella sp.]